MSKKTTTKSKSVLVTGGAGFIGSHLVDRLVREGYRVSVVDDLTNGRHEYLNPAARFYRLSVGSPRLAEVFAREKPWAVFHLAAHIDVRVSIKQPIRDAETNIHGSLNVLDQAVKHRVKRFIFASSGGAIYHDTKKLPTPETEAPSPLTPYGVAKLAFEHYLYVAHHQFGLPYVALRYSNVYGPRQDQKGEGGVIGVFCRKLASGKKPAIFGDGRQTRDFIYVSDVIEANLLALSSKRVGTYHVSTGEETSVNRIGKLAAEAFGWKDGFSHGGSPKGDVRRSVLDASKAKKELGWTPDVDVEVGMRRTADWFRSRA